MLDSAALCIHRTRAGFGDVGGLESRYAVCRGKSQSIFGELWMGRMEAFELTQLRAGLTTMHGASSNDQLLIGTRATVHFLQFYQKAARMPRVRDFAARRLLAGAGIDDEGIGRSVPAARRRRCRS
jgi:hypothetical protein